MSLKIPGNLIWLFAKSKPVAVVLQPALKKMLLNQGESSYIEATFNSAGKRGKQRKTITIITNDPKESTVRLTITGYLLKYRKYFYNMKRSPKRFSGDFFYNYTVKLVSCSN